MPNNQLQIAGIHEAVLVDPATGKSAPHMVVTFKVGAHGPFTETFPKAGFDPSTVNQRVAEFAQKLGLIQGQN